MIAIRVLLTVLVGARLPGTTVFTLPSVDLPDWAAGVSLGGPVTWEQVLGAVYGGLQLAVILGCFGAVNAVSSAYRLLRSLPPVLHEAGVAVAVAVTLAPQLVVSVGRVRAARRLRGRPGGLRGVRGTVMLVLEDALERSVRLAASMDVRGYGRTAAVSPGPGGRPRPPCWSASPAWWSAASPSSTDRHPWCCASPCWCSGSARRLVGLALAGRRIRRTVYRPDPWALPEWLVSACGVGAAACMAVADSGAVLAPPTQPLTWPTITALAVLPAVFPVAPAWLSPPLPGRAAGPAAGRPRILEPA